MYYERYLSGFSACSGWASDEEIASSAGALPATWDRPEEAGVVLYNQNGRLVLDGGSECRHVLIIGATGTGKSRLLIIPSLLYSLAARNKRSFVVFDVKGELEAATRHLALNQGYEMLRIDLRHPQNGDSWNPFAKINRLYWAGEEARAMKLLEDIIDSVFCDKSRDPFWRNSSAQLFRGICYLIWEKGQDLSLNQILEYTQNFCLDGTSAYNPLTKDYFCLNADSQARRNLAGFMAGSDQTMGNVIASYNSYLSPFSSREDIVQMLSGEKSVDFGGIGLRPSLLYVSLPDDSTALGSLTAILLKQLTQELNECAAACGGRLPVRTELYIDELCNIQPAIPGLASSLTIARSRGMRYVLAIQSYAQLQGVYDSAAETIAANCSTWISLNIAKDESFRLKLSALCGKNALGEALITPSQLALLKYEEGIVIRERCRPYFTRFEDLSAVLARLRAHPLYARAIEETEKEAARPKQPDTQAPDEEAMRKRRAAKRLAFRECVLRRKKERDDPFDLSDLDFPDLDLDDADHEEGDSGDGGHRKEGSGDGDDEYVDPEYMVDDDFDQDLDDLYDKF